MVDTGPRTISVQQGRGLISNGAFALVAAFLVTAMAVLAREHFRDEASAYPKEFDLLRRSIGAGL